MELAKFYNTEGADEVVFLDITASYENRATMLDVVRRINPAPTSSREQVRTASRR